VDPTRPESHGPFLVYFVPDLEAVETGKEVPGYYMLLKIDPRFPDMDEEINWYSGSVTSTGAHCLFKMPAWPFSLWPNGVNAATLYDTMMSQLPPAVVKSFNACHSTFDTELETAELESRKWKYVMLDFSKCKDGTLSSKLVFIDAGEKEVLDYDVIEVPDVDKDGNVLFNETYLGFRVGVERGGRKVVRTSHAVKSKLQQKREAAAEAREEAAAEARGAAANGKVEMTE
jgi:hypothetical protein